MRSRSLSYTHNSFLLPSLYLPFTKKNSHTYKSTHARAYMSKARVWPGAGLPDCTAQAGSARLRLGRKDGVVVAACMDEQDKLAWESVLTRCRLPRVRSWPGTRTSAKAVWNPKRFRFRLEPANGCRIRWLGTPVVDAAIQGCASPLHPCPCRLRAAIRDAWHPIVDARRLPWMPEAPTADARRLPWMPGAYHGCLCRDQSHCRCRSTLEHTVPRVRHASMLPLS